MADNDGSIRIGVQVDNSAATKSLKQLASQAEKLGKSINGNETKHNSLSTQLEDIRTQLSETYAEMDVYQEKIERFNELSAKGTHTTDETVEFLDLASEQNEAKKLLDEKTKAAAKLEQQEAKVKAKDDEILTVLTQQKAELEKQQGLIGEKMAADAEKGSQAVGKLKEKTSEAGEASEKAAPNYKKLFSSILKYGLGIRSVYILVNKLKAAITESYTEMAKSDDETRETLTSFKSALAELKGSFGAAFSPIISAVIPILNTLINWLTKAANAIQTFLSVLTGKSTYKKAVANAEKINKELTGASGSAQNLLMSIDELNILSESGGSGSTSDYSFVDELIDGESFSAKLAVSFKDVFFDWSDLTGEQIAEKVCAGLTGLAGGIIGFAFGGVGGAIVGTIAGLALGCVIDALTFDHDGTISDTELADMIRLALGAMIGGALGFALGGPVGAAIGATLGVVLTLGINQLDWVNNAREEQGQYDSKVSWFLCGVLGLPTDQEILGWLENYVWEKGILAFLEELLTLITGTDYAGLSGEELGNQIVDGIKNAFANMPKFHLSWDLESYSGSFFGKQVSVNIPWPNLSFYARGGIVDSATLFGSSVVGEDGQEAIVPLENHTEWISMVAEGLIDDIMSSSRLAQLAQAFTEVSLPAMATGGIIPPGIQTLDDDLKEIQSTLNRVVEMLGSIGNSDSNGGNYKFYLDGKEISSVVTKYQRQNARATGV